MHRQETTIMQLIVSENEASGEPLQLLNQPDALGLGQFFPS